ncbi:hypothetical protein LY78DRAFT_652812 [Colletotrichum sublineola]|nr:hypothetical protein LY78DRAFT_652812 [Colletotrichum sublineola]
MNRPSHRSKLGPPSRQWFVRRRSTTELGNKPISGHRISWLSMHPRTPEISYTLAAALAGFDTCASYPTGGSHDITGSLSSWCCHSELVSA